VSQKINYSKVVHVRLDPSTAKLLRKLEKRLAWNRSRILREGIRALDALVSRGRPIKVRRMGRFASGVPDLGSNKAHLKGFGGQACTARHR